MFVGSSSHRETSVEVSMNDAAATKKAFLMSIGMIPVLMRLGDWRQDVLDGRLDLVCAEPFL